MSFYSKISLCALLATGTALGMELPLLRQGLAGQAPRLNAPVQNKAAQALNQPMIKVFSDRGQIDTIQSNYLEASATLKNMLHDVDQNKALVLPESMIEDYVAIKDLLVQEYRLNAEITDEKTVINILKSKTEQQLVAIANACQRFELNKVGECTIALLVEKLNTQPKKEECFRNGSYNLDWTPDVAHLIAKEMYKDNKIFYLTLTDLTARKQGKISFWQTSSNKIISQGFTTYDNFIRRFSEHSQHKNFTTLLISKFYWIHEHPELLESDFTTFQKNDPTILANRVIRDVNIFGALKGTEITTLYWQIDSEIVNISSNLKPEQVCILIEYCNKTDQMPAHLREKLPKQIRQLLFPNWWQRKSLLSKAAIITGAAATGLAAWYGYKYFSKK